MAAGFNCYLIAPASVIPLLVDAFGIDKPTAGLSIGVFFLSWGVAGLPGGWLMDRHDNRRLALAGTAVFVAASVATAYAPTYDVFLLARLVGGATGAFLWTANANIVSRVFPESKLALGTSLFVAAGPTGQAIAQFLGPVLAETAGWRSVFLVYPVLAVVGVPVLYAAVPDPIRSDEHVSLARFARTLRNPTILAVSLASACSFALFVFFNSWMPTYATEVLSIDLAAAGAATALVPFAGVLARPGGGWLSDRIDGRRRPVIVSSFLLSLPVIVGVTLASSAVWFAVVMAFAGASVQLAIGVYYVYASELAAPGTRGTCLAMVTSVSTMGALAAPVVGGWLIEGISWTAGYGFAALLALVGIGFTVAAPES
ncbi:MFS transporter [Halomarina pelagica]|uniref:MFS transporter n=1 Tax=Halomarina pelagica TaxID=2961599 RepID=UPI0020C5AA59|nr:MFS transporter [Halomarina sp. BND7]